MNFIKLSILSTSIFIGTTACLQESKAASLNDTVNKVVCKFTLKRWVDILTKYVAYCESQKINYK